MRGSTQYSEGEHPSLSDTFIANFVDGNSRATGFDEGKTTTKVATKGKRGDKE